jgi:hypothetical protein
MNKIQEAKAILREAGYFVDNLWHVSDVQQDFKCTDEEAQQVLKEALTNSWTMSEIWSTIREYASSDYEPLNEEDLI